MNNLTIIDQDETFNFQINENIGALDGNTIGSGTEEPALGRDGDLYLKKTNGDLYKKINGAWTVIGNLIGPRGNPFVFEDFTIEQIEALMLPAVNGKQIAINAAETANEATYGANTARDEALSAASGANTARDEANTARDEASTATSGANAARDEALEAAIVANAARGWSPEYGIEDDGTIREVSKLIRWVGGTGDAPNDYEGQYVGVNGFVSDKAQAKNIKGKNAVINSSSVTSNVIGMGTKTFTLISPVDLVQGQVAKAYSLADPNNYICGYITNITPTSIEINAQEIGGIGTKTDWIIVLAAFRGIAAITTPNLSFGQLAAKYTAGNGSAQAVDTVGFYMGSDGKFYNGSLEINATREIATFSNLQGWKLSLWGGGTGSVRIKIPNNAISTIVIYGTIWQSSTIAVSFMISAYPNNLTQANTAIFIGGTSYPVSWYTDGSNRYIYIAGTNNVWGNSIVTIDKAQIGLNSVLSYATGWEMSLETAFVGTLSASRTAEQTLPNPGLNYPMTGYNAASGTETDVTPSTSPIQAFQNIEKKLGNRYTKAQGDGRYLPSTLYGANNGCLITTSILAGTSIMFQLEMLVHDYSNNKLPTKILLSAYNNTGGNVFAKLQSTSLGDVNPTIDVFISGGFVCFWISPLSTGATFHARVFTQTANGGNLITSITNVVRPTGTTRDATVTPVKTMLERLGTAPANATATGTAGTVIFDANYIYVCTATNTWKRTPLTTW